DRVTEGARVRLAQRFDRVADDLTELDPLVAGGVRVPAADLLTELRRGGVRGENLTQHRLLDVAPLDDVLGVALKLLQGRAELFVVRAEQLLRYRVVAGQYRAEAQRQHGHLGGAVLT